MVLVTENMIYLVEYKPTTYKSGGNLVKNRYDFLIGSVIFPLILLVIIVLMIFRALEKHSK